LSRSPESNLRLRAEIVLALQHAEPNAAINAAKLLARNEGAGATAELLQQLQHPIDDVVTAARQLLQQLRDDREQRAYWTEANSGIDLRPQTAATKLLQQAKAGEPKEQRLLALRSLAALGAAEALPYLIDATKDADADIAAAARATITAIHQRSGAEPGKR
jgi:HEAT repeat protein